MSLLTPDTMAALASLPDQLHEALGRPLDVLPRNVGTAERVLSAAAGAALVGVGVARGSWGGVLLATVGGVLAFRGTTGYCPAYGALGHSTATPATATLDAALTINRPRSEVFGAWTPATLAKAMQHVAAVEPLGGGRTRWTAEGPGGHGTLTWVAEETHRAEGREISWHTLEGDVDHAGRVTFADAPGGRGTEVHVHWTYVAPTGTGLAARFVTPALELMIRDDLRRFRALLEAGEVPTTEGQPKGA
jgi:uncharacterized membrane protein